MDRFVLKNKPLLFSLFDHTALVKTISERCFYEIGDFVLHQFPDEETYIKINSPVKDRAVILLASLDHPNDKAIPLFFAAQTLKDLGAKEVGLVAPYLAYMRQDKRFNPGEGISSHYFADLISHHFDWLVTIDPHLHRKKSLAEIYAIPTTVLHASHLIAKWVNVHVAKPLLIGPDQESDQWVSDIAQKIHAPYVVLEKIRSGDRTVDISFPSLEQYQENVPILIDDIISTAKTMMAAVNHLKNVNKNLPICIGVHGIFAGNAYQDLLNTGVAQVVTCNTIKHDSNAIDIATVISDWLVSGTD